MGSIVNIGERVYTLVTSSFMEFRIRDVIDILFVAFLIYQAIKITRETRAMQVIKGMGVLLICASVANAVQLQSMAWLLNQALLAGSIAIVVIFQPELRRCLEQIGRGSFVGKQDKNSFDGQKVVRELIVAMENMASRRVGALIIVQRQTGLAEIISSGTSINGLVSAALLENIFEPNTPLHDGAVIIDENIIKGAGCFLPLSDNNGISRQLGTRHRAAMGISEVSDCLAFIVSEETGVISCADDGKLTRYLDAKQMKAILKSVYEEKPQRRTVMSIFKRESKKSDEQDKE